MQNHISRYMDKELKLLRQPCALFCDKRRCTSVLVDQLGLEAEKRGVVVRNYEHMLQFQGL